MSNDINAHPQIRVLSMLTEVEIEDVGVYRLPNMWQQKRIQQVRGPNRRIATLAVGLGLTYKEFRSLPLE